MAHETGKLESAGLLVATEQTWEATTGDSVESLGPAVLRDLSAIVRKFKSVPTNQVLDEIYAKFPEYVVLSKRKKLVERSAAELAVYMAGYKGLSVDTFLNGRLPTGFIISSMFA